MKNILYLRAMGHEFPSFLKLAEARGVTAKHLREVEEADFSSFDAILIPAHIDQRGLLAHSDGLQRFLRRGGTLVFNGHLVYPVFPDLALFVPAPGGHMDDLVVERVAEHPIFAGVLEEDLSFRRGVAGFYGRGANPPPPGAQILHRLKADGSPLDWLWECPQGGRILMHSGNTMWMYVDDDTSTARIAPQLLNWLESLPAARSGCDGNCRKAA